MGFITNRFLVGVRERHKPHKLVEVKVYGEIDVRGDNIGFNIKARRSDKDYQEMFLTQDELDELLPAMINVREEQSTRLKIALDILADLTDAELLQFVTRLLSERAKSVESQAADTQP